jgi:type IX secretion system PorP/SprF family membrane protein
VRKIIVFNVILLSILCKYSYSQEYSIYNNDYLDPFIINPAATGAEYYPVAKLSIKKQWLGFPGTPSTYMLTGNYRIGNYDFYDPKGFVNKGPLKLMDRIGLGAGIYQDNDGPLSYTGIILSYAYHIPINSDSRLSLGLSGIGTLYSINKSILKPNQEDDAYLLGGNSDIFRVNLNFGIYYHNGVYFAGLSFNKLLPDIINVNNQVKLHPSYFIMGGYKFMKNSKSFNYEPSLTIKKLGNENVVLDIHNKLYVKRLNWIALSYSTMQKLNLQFGLHLYKMVYAGYNYEHTLSDIASYNFGSHEIYIGINIGLVGVEGIRETVSGLEK